MGGASVGSSLQGVQSSLFFLFPRSSENQLTMHKCFFFLVFMVIILPSLGLTRYRPTCSLGVTLGLSSPCK